MNQPDRDAIRRVLAEADGFKFDCLEAHDYQRHVDALLALFATPAAQSPADRAALRERIAKAVERLHETGGLYALDAGEPERIADAVLALLPPAVDPAAHRADRAAVLEETATALEAQTCTCGCRRAAEYIRQRAAVNRAQDARRLADEAQYAPVPAPRTTQDTPGPRLFRLQRDRDVSGVSGTGHVADGVRWPDGTVTIRWRGDRPSTVHWDQLADAEAVHGHQGATRIVWADEATPTQQLPAGEAQQ
jgi:hypothetical protein